MDLIWWLRRMARSVIIFIKSIDSLDENFRKGHKRKTVPTAEAASTVTP